MHHWLDDVALPASWIDVRGRSTTDAKTRAGIAKELRRELGRKHALRPMSWQVAAMWRPQDDVLLALDDGRAAIVHLTFALHPEPPPWPGTEIFPALADLEAAFTEREELMGDD
ncbi:MAG: hypothetical protein DLM55_03085 [Acidimicrobiales bacterium]|nr:MAG: hypothetical protein DLM55_03085 [Acidimicrobiales bacterium]